MSAKAGVQFTRYSLGLDSHLCGNDNRWYRPDMEQQYETLCSCILCDSSKIRQCDEKLLLSKCTDCGLVFDNPRPTTEAIEEYYSKKGSYDRKLVTETRHDMLSRSQLRRVLRFKRGGSLLDVGAGFGQFLRFAGEHFDVAGTEISTEGVEIARRKYDLELMHGEVDRIDFGGRKFDVITLFQVVEHFPYPGRTLQRCVSLLKPGGILYIAAPNEAAHSLRLVLPGLLSRSNVGKFKSFGRSGHRKINFETMNEIHVSHFSESVLKRFLKKAGLAITGSGVDFLDPYTFSRGFIQIPRHALFYVSWLVRQIAGVNIYNGMWIAAKKKG